MPSQKLFLNFNGQFTWLMPNFMPTSHVSGNQQQSLGQLRYVTIRPCHTVKHLCTAMYCNFEVNRIVKFTELLRTAPIYMTQLL